MGTIIMTRLLGPVPSLASRAFKSCFCLSCLFLPVVRTEINRVRADPLSTDSKPVGTFQNGTIQNASSTRPHLDREPDLPRLTRKRTSVKLSESGPRSSATEPQKPLGPSHVEKHEPDRSVRTPRPPSQASRALSGISRGTSWSIHQ